MSLANQLLHQIADPSLTPDERVRLRCQPAKQLEEKGSYETALEIMGELWQGVGHRPVLDDLDLATAAEVLLRAGVLTGWIGSCKQIEGAQETAKNLISESITRFEALGDIEKIAEAQMEIGYCYWREGAFNEARVWLKEALEAEGWTVETCREGATAMRMLESDARYDVLIFDNQLPDIDGVELIQRTRALPYRQNAPIIMLSASDVELAAQRAGADAFLQKPNDMMKISETIARLLARKSKH